MSTAELVANIAVITGIEVRPLSDQITELYAKVGPERAVEAKEIAAAIEASGQAPGLALGSLAPEFILPDASGSHVNLAERLLAGPVVLCFYRGEWCPPCNLTLRAYQQRLDEIRGLGASLIAISPQAPSQALTMQERHNLEFDVLSDTEQDVAAAYGLRYDLPDLLVARCKREGIDFGARNADGSWRLPVSATYVVDRDGVIRARHVDPNYSARMDPEDALSALRGLEGDHGPRSRHL